MPHASPIPDLDPMAFFNLACDYHEAANLLFDQKPSLNHPIYFCYFHTVELALKAFLRSENIPVVGTEKVGKKGHNLTDLYEECRTLGLTIGPSDQFEIGNIVRLLEAGNKYQGFRYFNLESDVRPDITWTREVVEHLMQAVKKNLIARSVYTTAAGPAVKLTMTWGKPTSQDQSKKPSP